MKKICDNNSSHPVNWGGGQRAFALIVFSFIFVNLVSAVTIISDTSVNSTSFNVGGNLTLGQKITFALGEVIDNIVDGWVRVTGGLNVTEGLVVGGDLSVNDSVFFVNATSGNVGIGTAIPGSELDVNGNIHVNSSILSPTGTLTLGGTGGTNNENITIDGETMADKVSVKSSGSIAFDNPTYDDLVEIGSTVAQYGATGIMNTWFRSGDTDQYIGFRAGTTEDYKSYLAWYDYEETIHEWLMGRNSANQFILYDKDGIAHRLVLNSGGDSYISSAGTGAVIINKDVPDNGSGTGGFEVWSGGAGSVQWFDVAAAATILFNGANLQINSPGDDKNVIIEHDDTTTNIKSSSGGIKLSAGNGLFYLQHNNSTTAYLHGSTLTDQVTLQVLDAGGNQFILSNGDSSFVQDFDHPFQTDPTLFIHSDTSPNDDNTEWLSMAYINAMDYARIETGKGDLALMPAGNVGIGISSPSAKLDINASGAALNVQNETGSSKFFVNATSGNVGINTTSPNSTLTVNGIMQTLPRSSATCDSTTEGGIYYDSDDNHFYGCNSTAWVQLNN